MKKILALLIICIIGKMALADTTTISRRLDYVEHVVKRIDANQLNYKIEKDLLKETYSNNYEKISLVITLILGIMGVLGYLGLKDISTIRKEYELELNNLRQIQGQFELKSKEFDSDKKKLDEELKSIIKENEEQSRKIKFIELKEKVRTLLKENSLSSALEFANAALNISSEDTDLLNQKGRILCRLNQMKDAIDSFLLAKKLDPSNNSTVLNTAECLYFGKDLEGAKNIVHEHKGLFESRENGKLLELFDIIELYFLQKKDDLLQIAKSYVTFPNLKTTGKAMSDWDLTEAKYFIHYQPDSEMKPIFQNILWYWDGQITGEALLTNLKLDFPKPPEATEEKK